jgi:hypothetical protein
MLKLRLATFSEKIVGSSPRIELDITFSNVEFNVRYESGVPLRGR